VKKGNTIVDVLGTSSNIWAYNDNPLTQMALAGAAPEIFTL
jgi:hypothetical protein